MGFLRIVLWPFSLIYGLISGLRNHLYDIKYTRSFKFETIVIGVGNLSVGGSGKSPFIEYLIRLLKDDFNITTLSRGYKRKTKGFRKAGEQDTAESLGDEPFQFYYKFKNQINVAVSEDRALAIPEILFLNKEKQVILMDDSFQHRTVIPDLNILLTDFQKSFFNDYLLPSGRLRETRKGASRADVIVVTKCPDELSDHELQSYKCKIEKYANHCPVFFSGIKYLNPRPVFPKSGFDFCTNVLLFSGIASPGQLEGYLESNFNLIDSIRFSDHHYYTRNDLNKIIKLFEPINLGNACLVTTEKDMVKLKTPEIENILKSLPIFYIPIQQFFLKNGKAFDKLVLDCFNK